MFNNAKKKPESEGTKSAEDLKKPKILGTYYSLLTAIKTPAPFKLESHSKDEVKSTASELESEKSSKEKTPQERPDFGRKK